MLREPAKLEWTSNMRNGLLFLALKERSVIRT